MQNTYLRHLGSILNVSIGSGIIMSHSQQLQHYREWVFHLGISPILDPEIGDGPQGAILDLSS